MDLWVVNVPVHGFLQKKKKQKIWKKKNYKKNKKKKKKNISKALPKEFIYE